MAKSDLKRKILEVSGGTFKTLLDISLFFLVLTIESAGSSRTSVGANRAFDKALAEFSGVEEDRVRKARYALKSKGLVSYSLGKSDVRITKLGRSRLESVVPMYEKERPWDNKLYLITYDVPETQKAVRDSLRDHLKKMRCGMLQASVWVTPYDPRGVLKDFVYENNLLGYVLISDLTEKSSIGGEKMADVLSKVYDLEDINERYRAFLENYASSKQPAHIIVSEYLSILKDDPQIPFRILPNGWLGDKAFEEVFTLIGKWPLIK